MKLWGGRFGKATDGLVDDFHSSISFDQRLFEQDITGSIAHATMLGEQRIIPAEDAEKIVAGLKGILEDARAGKITWRTDAEDIHMNVETLLTERIGDAGKRLHTGRSRNDQVALDTRMYAKAACRETEAMLEDLLEALLDIAQENLHTIMPGYTHMQKAQPITLAHHMMAYVQMFLRDRKRFRQAYEAADVMVLGSGALAGTTYPLNRERVAELLEFSAVSENSLDGVSDRDYMLDYLAAASICMMHLSRFCEELILWNTNEFRFVEMDDGFSTGSSIMPQKKNPDVAELIRGKTGRVYGHLMGLLTVMKGLPLAYNKDMQEDKEAFFDARDTLVNEPALAAALESGAVKCYVTDFPTPGSAHMKNAIVIPHLGASTEEAEDNCAVMAVKQLQDYLDNGNIHNSVNYPEISLGFCETEARVGILHRNIPNMLSQITNFFGNQGLNIENLANKSRGDFAYTLLDISHPMPRDTVERLKEIDGVIRVRRIVENK